MNLSDAYRGISPVIGVVVLVGIVIILAMVTSYAAFNLSQEREPQPNTMLELDLAEDGATHILVHEGGETLNGDKVELKGAADPQVLDGTELTTDDTAEFYPVEETVKVVYHGEHGTSYLMRTFEALDTVPDPDDGCDWVEQATNNGTSDVTVKNRVVSCDVITDGDIVIGTGGVVLGEVHSRDNSVDVDGGEVTGMVTASGDVTTDQAVLGSGVDAGGGADLAESEVGGPVTAGGDVSIDSNTDRVEGALSSGGDVSIDQGTVEGPITGSGSVSLSGEVNVQGPIESDSSIDYEEGTVEGSITVDGDVSLGHETAVTVKGGIDTAGGVTLTNITVANSVTTDSNDMQIGQSSIGGTVATSSSVTLTDSTVGGDVYVGDDFSCTDSTIGGSNCAGYSALDYGDY